MTDAEFWTRVGEELQRLRLRNGKKSPNAIDKSGGPTNKTVQAIEEGKVGDIQTLAKYAEVVQVTLVDLFRSVLQIEREETSPELEAIKRAFRDGDVAERAALCCDSACACGKAITAFKKNSSASYFVCSKKCGAKKTEIRSCTRRNRRRRRRTPLSRHVNLTYRHSLAGLKGERKTKGLS